MSLASFRSVRLVGGIVPADALTRAADLGMPGQGPDDYELTPGVAVTAAVARSWNDLLGAWQERQRRLASTPGEAANRITRDRWLLPLLAQLGYGRVPALPSGIDLPPGLGESAPRHYPISHQIGWPATAAEPTAAIAIHLVADTTPLDKRTPGIAARAPHGMVQEFVNHSDRHLYALLGNGSTLRLLRDASSLTKQSYIEFDLDTMFGQQLFADFRLMWLILHATRLAPKVQDAPVPAGPENAPDGDSGSEDEQADEPAPDEGLPRPEQCWLEAWRSLAISEGTRARDALEAGVAAAITALGTGFVSHPANDVLRTALKETPELDQDLRKWLLRCVYRLIVLFVAEDRELLHPDDMTDQSSGARDIYAQYFSSGRLRRLAATRTGTRHSDLWPAHLVVTDALGGDGSSQLALPALAESLFGRKRIGLLAEAQISNRYLLAAVRHLSQVTDRRTGSRVSVDYRNLDSEELGGVYEGLLAYVPRYDPAARTFSLTKAAGSERKKSGSYYTPTELIALVLDETLDPLIGEALRAPGPEQALLNLTVCDPACGSGHFLVAAARRIALALAVHRSEDPEPSPPVLRQAMRDVVARCIYGVDLNELAIEVAKVALWLEALTPGKPFAFLDHHLKVGNALLGTTPKLVRGGIPDGAYGPLDGDDPALTNKLKAKNRSERTAAEQDAAGQLTAFDVCSLHIATTTLSVQAKQLDSSVADDVRAVREQADAWRRLGADPDLQQALLLHDTWCSAFLQNKTPEDTPAITHRTLTSLHEEGETFEATTSAVQQEARTHRFFHWHLEFPSIFTVPEAGSADVDPTTGWTGGFACVIGNPPWETLQLSDKEFFSALGRDDIAGASTASKRKKAIAALAVDDVALHAAYRAAARRAGGQSHFASASGRFALTGRGKINTYSVFAETFRTVLRPRGRAGLVTPTGLATDATTAPFIAEALRTRRLASFYDFENEAKIFPAVHHAFRFAVSSYSGEPLDGRARFAFMLRHIQDAKTARFEIAPEELLLLNPNTGTLPTFRARKDAEITVRAYRRHPVLISEKPPAANPWGLTFRQGLFNTASDSGLFRDEVSLPTAEADGWSRFDEAGQRHLPLYEAKFLWHYDDRFSSYLGATQAQLNMQTLPRVSDEEHDDPDYAVRARHWVQEKEVSARLDDRWSRDWLLGWRDITGAEKARTLAPFVFPRAAAGDPVLLALPLEPAHGFLLQAVWSSFACDYITRQKLSGTHLNYTIFKQIAVPAPSTFAEPTPWEPGTSLRAWIRPYVLELTYTSSRMSAYAEELGDSGRPFRWDTERRQLLKSELDAAFMHLYGFTRDDVEHVLDSFPVVARSEVKMFGEYRTRRLVLSAYDQMAAAAGSGGTEWASAACPAAGDGPRHWSSTRTG